MKKTLLLLATLLLAGAAQAQKSPLRPQIMKCLGQATNYEILTEVNDRMSSGGGLPTQPQSQFSVTVACSANELKYSKIDLQTGKTASVSYYLGSSSQCDSLAQKVLALKDLELHQNKLVAVCSANELKKYILDTEKNLTSAGSEYYGSSSQCETALSQLNP